MHSFAESASVYIDSLGFIRVHLIESNNGILVKKTYTYHVDSNKLVGTIEAPVMPND